MASEHLTRFQKTSKAESLLNILFAHKETSLGYSTSLFTKVYVLGGNINDDADIAEEISHADFLSIHESVLDRKVFKS